MKHKQIKTGILPRGDLSDMLLGQVSIEVHRQITFFKNTLHRDLWISTGFELIYALEKKN